jgi:uncharacterized protein (DUF1778 family)
MLYDEPRKPARPWRVVAEEAAHELDPKKMVELMRELNQALDEEEALKRAGQRPDQRSA